MPFCINVATAAWAPRHRMRGALWIACAQAFHPLSSPACCQWALQSDVTITNWSLVGQGRLVARIEGALYNDRTNGSGTGPDINRPGTQVGDAFAAINMGNTAVPMMCSAATRPTVPFHLRAAAHVPGNSGAGEPPRAADAMGCRQEEDRFPAGQQCDGERRPGCGRRLPSGSGPAQSSVQTDRGARGAIGVRCFLYRIHHCGLRQREDPVNWRRLHASSVGAWEL